MNNLDVLKNLPPILKQYVAHNAKFTEAIENLMTVSSTFVPINLELFRKVYNITENQILFGVIEHGNYFQLVFINDQFEMFTKTMSKSLQWEQYKEAVAEVEKILQSTL